jgi:hypothetical protein
MKSLITKMSSLLSVQEGTRLGGWFELHSQILPANPAIFKLYKPPASSTDQDPFSTDEADADSLVEECECQVSEVLQISHQRSAAFSANVAVNDELIAVLNLKAWRHKEVYLMAGWRVSLQLHMYYSLFVALLYIHWALVCLLDVDACAYAWHHSALVE